MTVYVKPLCYHGYKFTQRRPLKNAQFRSRSRRMRILTAGIYRIFRGLEPECNAEIGRKGVYFEGLMKGGTPNGYHYQKLSETA